MQNKQGEGRYTIVGVARDVRYTVMYSRGTSDYGNGTSKGFIFLDDDEAKRLSLNKDLINLFGNDHFYNQLLIQVEGAKNLNIYSDAYEKKLDEVEVDINDYMTLALDERYEQLVKDKKDQLKAPLASYEQGLHDYEIAKAQAEVQLQEAKIGLTQGKISLIQGKQQLLEAQGQATDQVDIDKTIGGLTSSLNDLKEGLAKLEDKLHTIENGQLPKPELPEIENPPTLDYSPILTMIDQMQDSIKNVEDTLHQATDLATGILQLEGAKLQIEKAELELDQGESMLYLKEEETKRQLEDAKLQLDQAKVEIDKAQALIDQIPKPDFFLLDQSLNEGLVSFRWIAIVSMPLLEYSH